jgi:hypothetical protein
MVKTGRGEEQLLQPQPESIDNYFVFNELSTALDAINNSTNLAKNS